MLSQEPSSRGFCFVIMPFSPEMKYFYFYLKRHIEQQHHMTCERADANVETRALWDKILSSISKADLIVADCSDNNPNVLYELGFAHALKKDVILLTRSAISSVPSDIRHLEFIKYDLDHEPDLIAKLDNAIGNWWGKRYEPHYQRALGMLLEFRRDHPGTLETASTREFLTTLELAERAGQFPASGELADSRLLLRALFGRDQAAALDSRLEAWLERRYPFDEATSTRANPVSEGTAAT